MQLSSVINLQECNPMLSDLLVSEEVRKPGLFYDDFAQSVNTDTESIFS